jgi:hypothetical protein
MSELDKLPGIKQRDTRKCVCCGKGVAHDGNILFYRLTLGWCGLNRQAIESQSGLEMMLGGHAMLAHVMGADEDMAKIIDTQKHLWVCLPCADEVSPHYLYEFLDGYPKPETEAP